jgi:hypothetical protein
MYIISVFKNDIVEDYLRNWKIRIENISYDNTNFIFGNIHPYGSNKLAAEIQ